MIEYRNGNLLADDADALVNTVNCVGVMGKGIALAFKSAYPDNYRLYREACLRCELTPGGLFVTETNSFLGPSLIVNAATKSHWRDGSRFDWIEHAAAGLASLCQARAIRSMAVPAMGCSNGGLPWEKVRTILERAFDGSATSFRIYPPH